MVERKRRRKGGGRSSKVAARQNISSEYTAYIERNIPYFEVLDEEGLALIENNADILLEEVGIEFRDFPAALKLFKDAGAEFKLNDDSILLTAKEDFHIKQMSSVLQEAITKRKMDIRILKPGKIEISNNTARQTIELQEGIDRELAKSITTLIKQSKIKVQAAIQGDSVRVTGKKRDELQETMKLVTDKKYAIPIQFDNFRD